MRLPMRRQPMMMTLPAPLVRKGADDPPPPHVLRRYGQSLGRNGMCRDSEASVVVTVSDTCPCE